MKEGLAAHYGSDDTGLVCGFHFNSEGQARTITASDALQWLADPLNKTGAGFLWLHFTLTNTATEPWLRRNLTLPDAFFEATSEGERSTRIEYVDHSLLAVINDVLYDFSFTVSDIATLFVSVTPELMVSARTKQLKSIDKLRVMAKNGELFRSTSDLMISFLRLQADVLVKIVREATIKVDSVEDSFLEERSTVQRGDLGTMRRVLVRLQRLLAPEPAALFRLLNRPPEWYSEHDTADLRESTEEFSSVLADMNQLNERIKLLQEELVLRATERTNKTLFTLTVVTVLAVPFNVIGAMFGMNVGGIPLNQDPAGFWIVVGLVVAVTTLAWFFLRRKG